MTARPLIERVRFVRGLSDADQAEARLGDDLVTRVCVVAVGACAVIGLAVAGLVEPHVAALDAFLVLACSGLARWTLRRTGLRPVRLLTWLVVGAWISGSALTGPAAADPSLLLGTLLAGFIAATAAEQDGTRRSTLVNVALGLAVLTLAAGVSPSAGLAVPIGVAWPAALVALLRVQPRRERVRALAMATARLEPRGRWALRRAAAVPVAACLVLGLAGFEALHALRGERDTSSAGGGFAGTGFGAGAPARDQPARLAAAAIGGALDLNNRGTLPDTPLFTVPAGSAQLWRTGSLDRYDGASWELSRSRVQLLPGGERIAVPPAPDDPVLAATPSRVDVVQALVPDLERVAAPGPVTAVQTSGGISLAVQPDGGLIATGEMALRDGYVVTSRQRPDVDGPSGDLLAAAGPAAGPAADAADPRWTLLPGTLPDRVRRLGVQLVGGQPDRVSAVRAVSDAIRTRAAYTLDSPVPAPGQDAVDDFLFGSRQGFCEQFASAEVVLLRAGGIPARVAVGFAGGDAGADPEVRVIRAKDAHAWVEVWFPGHGWASSDPTAGATLAGPGPVDSLRRAVARWWWLVVALAVALGAGVFWLARRRGGGGTSRPGPDGAGSGRPPHPGEPELVAAFARLEAALAASGAARQPHESLAELARRPHPQLPTVALTTLERLTFAPRPPDPHECRAAAAQLDDAAARLAVTR